jgi:inhibitor of cysteine peptidase
VVIYYLETLSDSLRSIKGELCFRHVLLEVLLFKDELALQRSVMMRVLVMLLVSLVLLSMLAGCSSTLYAVGLDASYDGKTVEVPSDSQLTVSLASNPTTGYEWVLAGISDMSVVELVDTYFVPYPSDLMGTGGMEVWTFQIVHGGSSLISIEYRQPWEEGVDPADTFSLNVVAHPTPTPTDTDSPCAVGLDASYDGKAVEVPLDCQLKVSLGSNPTTGYEWVLAGISDRSVVEFTDAVYLDSPSDLMGAGGMEVWTFQTVHAGSSLISMEYRRPWEEGGDPAHTFSLNIIVQ